MINPVTDINTDDLHTKKFPYPAPLEQSVLGVLPAIRTDETDRLKCPTRTSQLYYEQSCLQSSAWTISVTDIVNHTDVNNDMHTDLPESLAAMLKSPTVFEWPYVNSSPLSTLNPGIVNQTDVTFDMNTDPPESSAPMINSDLMVVDWEDIFYRRPRYCGLNTDSSEPDVWKRMDTADLVYMCRTVAQDERWSDTDDNSDTDSVAELEYNTWDDTCAWECRIALLILIQIPPTDIMRTYTENDEYPEKFGRGGCVDSSLHSPWICFGKQHCWGDGEIQNNANIYNELPSD